MSTKASIRLRRLGVDSQVADPARQHAFALTVQAYGEGMPSDVFVYTLGAEHQFNGADGDKFTAVASVSQMEELPTLKGQEISSVSAITSYRSDQVSLICRSAQEVSQIWEHIQEDVELLVDNWNAAVELLPVEDVVIGGVNDRTTQGIIVTPPTIITLKAAPAGTINLPVGVEQTIDVADATRPGWLPIADAPEAWTRPPAAAFAYNIAQDADLLAAWPPLEPFNAHQLHRDGTLLQYGVAYVFTEDTIWWLSYNPEATVTDEVVGSHPGYGSAPWPLDFVDYDNPGTMMNLRLALYKNA